MDSADLTPGKYRSLISFRPCRTPTAALPFGARSSGHCIARASWEDYPHIKDFVQIFWTVRGCGRFIIAGRECLLPEGWAALYYPGERHLLGAVSDWWEYRFLTLDGAGAAAMIGALDFPRFPVYAGPCPTEFFLQLAKEVMDISPRGQRIASATAYRLAALACGGLPLPADHGDALMRECEELIGRHFHDSEFNVNQLAELLGVHRSRLSRLFHARRGVTLIDYLASQRIARALTLLKETTWTVARIADLCGFSNADYLGKAVRKATGSSPLQFRRQ